MQGGSLGNRQQQRGTCGLAVSLVAEGFVWQLGSSGREQLERLSAVISSQTISQSLQMPQSLQPASR